MARPQMNGHEALSAAEIVGRAGELARLAAFLQEGTVPAAFVIEGEAGIGKTTLWRRGLAAATDHGRRVLACSPAESEADLSFAGLSDLLEGDEDLFDDLPDPQQYALEVALLRVQPTGPSPGWRAVSAAVLSVLRHLAVRGPVLIAIDDLQWLDASTARVLEFAIRRLEDEPVTFLLAQRGGAASPLPLGLGRQVAEDRVTRVTLAPLSPDEIGALMHARLGVDLPPSTMKRLYDVSAGNAFFALEIARAELRGDQRPTGQALPVPQNLRDDLIRDRLGGVSALGREALLYASACARPTVAIVEAAMEQSSVEPALAKAAEAGIVELQRGEIGFTHPLYRSAIYSEASREHRHEVQRRLAAVATDPEQRARHLALAAEGPDGSAVDALEAGASDAFARGSPATAAELCELAERLTPPEQDADVRRLRMAAAEYRMFAADVEGALRLLEPVAGSAPPGPERAEALLRLGQALLLVDDERAFGVLSEASSEEGAPVSVTIAIHGSLAKATASLGRLAEAELHAKEALALAERDGDPTQLAEAVTNLAMTREMLGRDDQRELVERAMALEGTVAWHSVSDMPSRVFAGSLRLSGDLEGARAIFESLLKTANDRGDEDSAGQLLVELARTELQAGEWEASLAHLATSTALTGTNAQRLGQRAVVEAFLGHVEAVRADAGDALAASGGHLVGPLLARSALGSLELSLGDPLGAREQLSRAWELHQGSGVGEPAMFGFVADLIEALIEVGDLEAASHVLDWLEDRGRALDRPWALAVVARYRGLIAAGSGDFPAAFGAFEIALKEHERLPMPFELGRTLLVLGGVRRRAKQKRPARDALEGSLAIFEQLGARLWAERARAEIARIGGRRPTGSLTEAETRVARLAVAGRTNREIADSLFMSVRTVEGHLSSAYRKLDVRSRTELALFFTEDEARDS